MILLLTLSVSFYKGLASRETPDCCLRRVYRLWAFFFPASSLHFIFWASKELCVFGRQQNAKETLL